MCSYCGCEAEPVIASLMNDHAAIATRARRIRGALADNHLEAARRFVAELASFFEHHGQVEEAGLFAQLRDEGEAAGEVAGLVDDHRRLVAGLSRPDIVERRQDLEQLLAELLAHAEVEDSDLFPFAMQVLPNPCWALVEKVHQELLTV